MASSKLVTRQYVGCINSDSTTIIFLLYTHKGRSINLSTGEKVHIEYWDKKRCEVKKSYRGYSTLNMVIQKFKEKVDTFAREAKLAGVEPTGDYIKEQLSGAKKVKIEHPKLFQFIEQFIDEQKSLKRPLTIRSYKTSFRQLKEYGDYIEKPISYEDIDLAFYNSFLSFLFKKRNLSNNSAGSHIKNIRLWMGVAMERSYHSNMVFKNKKFRVLNETADTIYLNENEIEKMYRYDFSYDKRLENTRNLFIIGAFTGLRYSDLSTLNSNNISNGMLIVNTRKTNEKVCIPIHKFVKEIMDRNIKETGEPFVKAFKGEQKFNQYIKTVACIVGITEPVVIRVSKGGVIQQVVYKKWELVSSHCCRRSFTTNAYKRGIPSVVIMRITGHRTERNLLKYIKISQENAADMLKELWDKMDAPAPPPVNKPTIMESISMN